MQSAHATEVERAAAFPLGAALTLEQLEDEPQPLLARLRRDEPVSWLPALGAWLVTTRDLALQVMRDPVTFTVDDPRFSTAQVVGRSMLSTDGAEHERHRGPFARPFRLDAVRARFEQLVETEVERLLASVRAAGRAELRRSLAGPLAVASMVHALGLADTPADAVLRWYDAIVGDVTEITAGRSRGDAGRTAFAELQARLRPSLEGGPESSLLAVAAREAGGLLPVEVLSNAGVLLFGGIETTEGMISNAILHVLSDPAARRLVQADATLLANAVEESLRLEPAAAVVDRYATRDVALAGSHIRAGELVRVSLAAAGRDPNTFPEPDRFDVRRPNAQQHLAFAQGPHVCLGMHLARVEARAALAAVLELPGVRLDPARPSVVRGLVFRKPQTLHVVWDAGG